MEFSLMDSSSTASTGPGMSSSRNTPRNSAASLGWCLRLVSIKKKHIIFNISLKFISSAVTEHQISAIIFYFWTYLHIFLMCWSPIVEWASSPLTAFEGAPCLKKIWFLGPIEVSCWHHNNGIMRAGCHCFGWIRIAIYFKVCTECQFTVFLQV